MLSFEVGIINERISNSPDECCPSRYNVQPVCLLFSGDKRKKMTLFVDSVNQNICSLYSKGDTNKFLMGDRLVLGFLQRMLFWIG